MVRSPTQLVMKLISQWLTHLCISVVTGCVINICKKRFLGKLCNLTLIKNQTYYQASKLIVLILLSTHGNIRCCSRRWNNHHVGMKYQILISINKYFHNLKPSKRGISILFHVFICISIILCFAVYPWPWYITSLTKIKFLVKMGFWLKFP